MKCQILCAFVLIVAFLSGPVSGDPIYSAVFTGQLSVMILNEPYSPRYNDVYYRSSYDNVTITNQGTAMADLLGQTSYNPGYVFPPCPPCGQPWFEVGQLVQSQAIGAVSLTGGKVPLIDLMGSATNGYVRGTASITYFYRLDKTVPDAPDVALPINLSGSASLFGESTTKWPQNLSYGTVAAGVSYKGPGMGSYKDIFGLRADSAKKEGKFSVQEILNPGGMAQIYMYVSGLAGNMLTSPLGMYGQFQGILDPQVEIDPSFLVSYNGEQVPATDLYSLTFSPEMTPPTEAPEPCSLFLLSVGLLGLMPTTRRL